MSQSSGGDDERIFSDNNTIRFEVPVDPAAREWWRHNFQERYGLTPEAVGDAL